MRKLLGLTLIFSLMVAVAACTGDDDDAADDDDDIADDDDDDAISATPTPGPYDVTITGDGGAAWPHPNNTKVFIRVLDLDSSNKVVICGQTTIQSGTFSVTSADKLSQNHTFHADAVADVGGNADMIDATDHFYSRETTEGATDDVTFNISHDGSTTNTWANGTPCP